MLFCLPVNELLFSFRQVVSVSCYRLIWYFSIQLYVGVVHICKDSDSKSFEVGYRSKDVCLVDFPETIILIFTEPMIDHFLLVDIGEMVQYFVAVSYAQVL